MQTTTQQGKNWIAKLVREGEFSKPKYVLNPLALPYVAFTGATKIEHITEGISLFNSELAQDSNHAPMIGILVSSQTMESVPINADPRYPKLSDIPALVNASAGEALITIHYDCISENQEAIRANINHLLAYRDTYSGGLCYAIQFIAPHAYLPRPAIVENLKRVWELKIVIPLRNWPTEGANARDAAQRICDKYGGIADYFLISQPDARGLDVRKFMEVYSELRQQGFAGIIGFAGSFFNENSKHAITQLRKELGREAFSLDSHCKLETDMAGVRAYLRSVSDGLGSIPT